MNAIDLLRYDLAILVQNGLHIYNGNTFLFINKANIIDFVEVCSDSVLSTFSKDFDQFLSRVLKIKYL